MRASSASTSAACGQGPLPLLLPLLLVGVALLEDSPGEGTMQSMIFTATRPP